MSAQKKQMFRVIGIVAMNILLVGVLILIFLLYKNDYEKKLYDQNINDITNINKAAASISAEVFASTERKLGDISAYVRLHPMTVEEVLAFVDETNRKGDRNFQLIGKDNNGYLIVPEQEGVYSKISYGNYSYKDLQKIFAAADSADHGINFSSEFTDMNTRLRSFAHYTYIPVIDASGQSQSYTLMAVTKTASFQDVIEIEGGFDDLSTALITASGGYVIRNPDFYTTNFYKYLSDVNGLTLDETNALQEKINQTGAGYVLYQNGVGRESVFAYSRIPNSVWFCVTAVPLSSFHTAGLDMTFALLLMGVLLAIMAMNFWWLTHMNIRLKKSMQEARQANKAKSDFLARMSHDIRTPINVINGMTELALKEPDRNEVNDDLRNIRSSGKFLLGLVNDVLDMNKVESGKMELRPRPYAYSEFVSYVRSIILPLCADKNIAFAMDGNADDLVLLVDSLRFNQIFFNLLSNAVKYTPSGGHVQLHTDAVPTAANRVLLTVTVRDDGIGMSKEFQKKMFEAFVREEKEDGPSVQGTGLGLAIVKRLTELMNGTLKTESTMGKGSVFSVTMEVETTDTALRKNRENMDLTALSGKRLLLCEDHPLNAKIIIKLMESEHIKIDWAANGKLGVETFAAAAEGYYDAILMDIRMPVMNGLEAAKAIRAMNGRKDARSIPIIALTANAYDDDVQNCLDAGMNEHIAKPVDSILLFETLARLVK